MELEHPADDHRDERLLHLDPVARHVPVEAVLAVEHVHVRVPGAGPLVEAPRDVQLLVQGVERIPVVRVPVVAVDQVRPDERPDRAQLAHAPVQLAAGQVHVVHRQHGHELEPLGAVPAELVDPVVVGLAEGERELRIHVVAREQAEAGGRVEDRDVHALDRHAHHLRLGVVVALDREVEPVRPLQPRAGERLRAVRARGPAAAALAILLQLGVHRGGQPVDDDRAALGPAVGPDREDHPVAELRIQVPLEEIGRLHDVHVRIDEAEVVFHGSGLLWSQTLS